MDAGAFLKVNAIGGIRHRVPFRDISILGCPTKVATYLKQYKRIVAVEDMVGTGTQVLESIPAFQWISPKPVLICPLVMAPAAAETWKNEIAPNLLNSHIHLAPLFVIPLDATIAKSNPSGQSPNLIRIRDLALGLSKMVCGSNPDGQYHGPFGFGDFGSLVLTYLNCPDNVPPMIHYTSETWEPLFPRNSREGK